MRFVTAVLWGMVAAGMLLPVARAAETCTTQSQMPAADRDALKAAATVLAQKIAANDQAGVRAQTIAEFQPNFTGMGNLIAATAPRLAGATPQVDQLYLLDASNAASNAASNPEKADAGPGTDAQFYCPLNKSQAEVDFAIPQLPPGRYAFATVWMDAPKPWLLSFLLRSKSGSWQLAGLYPKPLTAGGHDSLWYWKEGRALVEKKEPWNAWLYLQEAQALGQPASFVSSTHLEKLQGEIASAAPPALSAGISADTPLALKAADGTVFRFTSISVRETLGDALGTDRPDVEAHIKVDAMGDPATARQRSMDAMAALVDSHPELRKAFHGVSLFSDPPDGSPFGIERGMMDIR